MIVSIGVGAASVAVNETTGKTVTDHVVSTVNGKDCRVSRSLENKDVCQDEEPKGTVTVATVPTKNRSVDTVTRANDIFAQRARKSNEGY
jgi:hypothetical protein